MSLSNTAGAGRGLQKGSIIGDVINHGKKSFWGVANMHYHQGMVAGENTLNSIVARLLVRTLTSDKSLPHTLAEGKAYSPSQFLGAYVKFMTTPNSHNDTYAESWHRMFFANFITGKEPSQCADDDGHNIDSAGGLVLLPPPALLAAAAAAGKGMSEAIAASTRAAAAQQLATHNSQRLIPFSQIYATALTKVLLAPLASSTSAAAALKSAAIEAGLSLRVDINKLISSSPPALDTRVIGGGGVFSSACYIEGSLPALFFLAAKYAEQPTEAVIANTNVGGENCHRGSALGALVGAAYGMDAWKGTGWIEGLADGPAIAREADAFAAQVRDAYTTGFA